MGVILGLTIGVGPGEMEEVVGERKSGGATNSVITEQGGTKEVNQKEGPCLLHILAI